MNGRAPRVHAVQDAPEGRDGGGGLRAAAGDRRPPRADGEQGAAHRPTVLSTFSGVGGLDLGLHRAGWRHVGFAEADEYRRAVLAARFPGVPVWDDVRAVGGGGLQPDAVAPPTATGPRRTGTSPNAAIGRPGAEGAWHPVGVDLLCGGFPCQDLSVAGRRRGLAGERSGLFFAFADLAESLRPEWLLIENVPGLLSSNGGRDFGELLGTLADVGYGVAWRVLDSRFFGVPQRRRRVFIVAHDSGGRVGADRAGEVLAVGSGCGGHPAAGGEEGPGASGGIADGAGVSLPLTTGTGQRLDYETDDMVVVNALDRMAGGPDDNSAQAGHLVEAGASVRRLTPVECERLQGFPDGWTDIPWSGKPHTPDSRRYAACGDAVTVPVGHWIGSRLKAAMRQEVAA